MNKSKEIIVLGLALFSMFFGAGNLLFPPSLGVAVGNSWVSAGIGFFITGVGLPLLGILAFTKCGTLDNFANKVSSKFNKAYITTLILVIGPLFAIPRTGSTTFEMGVLPLIGTLDSKVMAIVCSLVFFSVTLFLVLNESKITDILGKFLTPIILIILALITIFGIINPIGEPILSIIDGNQFSHGFVSGYQTMDALASVLFGVVIIKGLEMKGILDTKEQKKYLTGAGFISAIGLGLIYFSLIYLGSQISSIKGLSTAQTALKIAELTLGNSGKLAFGICVAAACLTTSVGLTTLVSDWFSKLLGISYKLIAVITCVFSAVLAVAGLDYIISLAVPVLVILYPITIVLIVLNVFGVENKGCFVFTSLTALIISTLEILKIDLSIIPLANSGFAWVIPVIIAFVLGKFLKIKTKKC
ncbi:MAG: branched-chain amino acid transport system II carrier protein [Cetobacterium sp.]